VGEVNIHIDDVVSQPAEDELEKEAEE
jgi:hypothetical protein